MWLFLLFVVVPIIEIGLFVQVGGVIGLWSTLAIVLLTAIIGSWLVRAQGMAALQKMQSSLQTGQNPAEPIANGAFILVAGLLLLTPGFFTDAVGLSLLIPPVRQFLIKQIASRVTAQATVYSSASYTQARPASDTVLDGEFEVVEEDNINSEPGHSGWTRPND